MSISTNAPTYGHYSATGGEKFRTKSFSYITADALNRIIQDARIGTGVTRSGQLVLIDPPADLVVEKVGFFICCRLDTEDLKKWGFPEEGFVTPPYMDGQKCVSNREALNRVGPRAIMVCEN